MCLSTLIHDILICLLSISPPPIKMKVCKFSEKSPYLYCLLLHSQLVEHLMSWACYSSPSWGFIIQVVNCRNKSHYLKQVFHQIVIKYIWLCRVKNTLDQRKMAKKILSVLDVQRIIIKDVFFKDASGFFLKCLDQLQSSKGTLV